MSKENSWSDFSTEKLEWRREDIQKGIDADPEEEQTLIQFAAEIDVELESRPKSA